MGICIHRGKESHIYIYIYINVCMYVICIYLYIKTHHIYIHINRRCIYTYMSISYTIYNVYHT